MKILLWTDDLMGRVRIESRWKAAGAQMLRKDSTETPDLVVMDLLAKEAHAHIRRLRAAEPALPIVAFGPHIDGEAFRAAKEAGASECVARGAVIDRVLGRIEGR